MGVVIEPRTRPDARTGHFDRMENLYYLLETYSPPAPETATIDEYRSWSDAERHAFDDRRCKRIAASVVVETPAMKQLTLEYRRAALFAARPIGRTGIILSGPPTMGKTTAAFATMLQAFQRHRDRYPDWKDRGHAPVVYVELPSKCTGKNLMGRFMEFFGEPVHPRLTLEERTQIVTDLLTKMRTELVVVDEMQNLLRDTGQFESAQAMKNLMNSIKAVPMYVGINLEASALTNDDLGAQFAARCALVRLGRVETATPAGRSLWGSLIVSFEKQFALLNHPERTLLRDAKYLWTRTRGSIAALSRLLTIAALDVITDGVPEGELITVDRLDAIPLDLATERELERGNASTAAKRGARHAA